jgi:hypothetical protein
VTVMERPIAQLVDVRLFEWAFSVPLIMLGLAMLIWPEIAHGSILKILVTFLGSVGTGLVFVWVGLVSVAALIANGNSLAIGPRLRSLSAVIRSVFWITFTLSMARVSIAQGFPSPMVFFWSSFTGAEIFTAYRAARDVRYSSH